MKTIGLLGGLSPESSMEYYRVLNEVCRSTYGEFRSARCVLQSLDFGDIVPLIYSGREDEAGEIMASAARDLERAGADIVLICSNTCHLWADAVSSAISLPLLSIVDTVAAAVKSQSITKIGLIGTQATMEENFYTGRLADDHGLEVLIPDEDDRVAIERIIFGELVNGVFLESSRAQYCEIIERLARRGAQGVILGCTEIELLTPPDQVADRVSVPLFPTTRLHAEAAFSWSIGEDDIMPGWSSLSWSDAAGAAPAGACS